MLLSIIVPVYNCEKYLEECLESFYTQDLCQLEYEVICINDGSTDGSSEILETFALKYSNLKVIYKDNGGVASARNEGLLHAIGEYIWFIDSDDFIGKNTLGAIQSAIITNKYDRIMIQSYSFVSHLSDYDRELFDLGLLKSNYPHKDTQITRTIIRRKYIEDNDIKFYTQLKYGEDALFYFETGLRRTRDYSLKQLVYFYRNHKDASTSFNSITKLNNYFHSCCIAINIVNGYYKNTRFRNKSRKALLYWFNIIIWLYSDYEELRKVNCLDELSVDVDILDNKLTRKYKLIEKTVVSKDFSILEEEYKHYIKKKQKRRDINKSIRLLIGYIKHPKRIIKAIKR